MSRNTIKFSELKRLSFCNSKDLPTTVETNGDRYQWVGIGWVNEGKATGEETLVRDDEHTHDCEFFGLPYECGNGSDCELSQRDGYCCQKCYDHKR